MRIVGGKSAFRLPDKIASPDWSTCYAPSQNCGKYDKTISHRHHLVKYVVLCLDSRTYAPSELGVFHLSISELDRQMREANRSTGSTRWRGDIGNRRRHVRPKGVQQVPQCRAIGRHGDEKSTAMKAVVFIARRTRRERGWVSPRRRRSTAQRDACHARRVPLRGPPPL
jgi:hypothetical protein